MKNRKVKLQKRGGTNSFMSSSIVSTRPCTSVFTLSDAAFKSSSCCVSWST